MTPEPGVRCLWRGPCELGEGVLWSAAEGSIWFVDIVGQTLHRHELDTGRHVRWPTPGRPGFVALNAAGGVIVGLPKGLCHFSADRPRFERLVDVELDRP